MVDHWKWDGNPVYEIPTNSSVKSCSSAYIQTAHLDKIYLVFTAILLCNTDAYF